jgi:uncharacterized membrane protein
MAGTNTVAERSITIGRSADELYRLWRDPRNLSQIMGHIGAVSAQSAERTHWSVHAPVGRNIEWDTEIVEDRPGELLRWQSLADADVPNEGALRFRAAPRDWGVEVTLRVSFDPPGGALGKAALLGDLPETLVGKALRRFKSLAETGEIPTIEHQPAARDGGRDE